MHLPRGEQCCHWQWFPAPWISGDCPVVSVWLGNVCVEWNGQTRQSLGYEYTASELTVNDYGIWWCTVILMIIWVISVILWWLQYIIVDDHLGNQCNIMMITVYNRHNKCLIVTIYSVSQYPPPEALWKFFQNGWQFFDQILHAYYAFLSTLDYKFLFNYLQLWRSYAILSVTIKFTCAQNVHHQPKRMLAFSDIPPNS